MLKNSLCKLYMGCERLVDKEFEETRNCKNFMPAYEDWQEKFYKEIRQE